MKVLKLNLADNKDTEIFIVIDKIMSFRKLNPIKSKIVLQNGIIYEVIQTPEEILALIKDSEIEHIGYSEEERNNDLKKLRDEIGHKITGHSEVMGLLDDFWELQNKLK